jgi:hypothetical protein
MFEFICVNSLQQTCCLGGADSDFFVLTRSVSGSAHFEPHRERFLLEVELTWVI